ncbi:hypothetical protein BD408DRAFT_417470 [Parasitella parasitica]|nr:hypothetical protein BD408DRAFT_417470 [Parasitella parasitica]
MFIWGILHHDWVFNNFVYGYSMTVHCINAIKLGYIKKTMMDSYSRNMCSVALS